MDAGEVSGAHHRGAGEWLPPVFFVVWPQGHIQVLVGARGRTLLIAPLLCDPAGRAGGVCASGRGTPPGCR